MGIRVRGLGGLWDFGVKRWGGWFLGLSVLDYHPLVAGVEGGGHDLGIWAQSALFRVQVLAMTSSSR